MAQRTRSVSLARTKNAISASTRHFSLSDDVSGFQTPWKAAYPDRQPLGYWSVFQGRCQKISREPSGLIDEETAKGVWLSILIEYESYERMGMWIPEAVLEEHRQVARALGWY